MSKPYNIIQKGWIIISHLFLCLLFFTLSRLGFYWFNKDYFSIDSKIELGKHLFYGLRFDLSSISMVFGLLFFCLILPFKWKYGTSKLWSLLFVLLFGIVISFELADWKYFAFNQNRSNSEVLHMLSRPGDFLSLLPGFIQEYTLLFVLALLIIPSIYAASRFIFKQASIKWNNLGIKYNTVVQIGAAALLFLLLFIGIRGGTQLVPISARNAIAYTTNENVPIVINSTFNIITSIQNQSLEKLTFIDESDFLDKKNVIKSPNGANDSFVAKNVVVIILESFSKEFTGLSNNKRVTPFLDSLMKHSYVFSNAYANAFQSAQAIPAILSGIPGWMDQSLMTSAYANNKINSFANLLGKLGYTSSFYHGATNGSMSFDVFTKNAGYQYYFGRSEYNNEKDYDGNWGIWDEPFFQAVAKDLGKFEEPFHATLFNINSHPPYTIPEEYKRQFVDTGLAIYKSIRYSDYALQQFFKTASQQKWFSNTIFIITADHCSPLASNEFYQNHLGKFQIPIFFYDPSQAIFKPGINNTLMQQIDILPTILDTLNYPNSFYAIGKSIWKADDSFMLTKVGSTFYGLYQNLQLNITDHLPFAAYVFPNDSLNTTNIVNTPVYQHLIDSAMYHYKLKLQTFTNDMIDNKMYVK